MESIKESKFQQLSNPEMKNINGGATLIWHSDCVGGVGGSEPRSESIYRRNWLGRLTHESDTYTTYDKASCS